MHNTVNVDLCTGRNCLSISNVIDESEHGSDDSYSLLGRVDGMKVGPCASRSKGE